MMNIVTQVLAFMITILVLVSFHEAGHFLAAKWLGIRVLRFSIGFGKPLLKFRDKKNTEYVVALFPLGGYVKLLDEREAPVAPPDLPFAFNRQPLWTRTLVVIAGPLTNFIFAILGFWLMFIIGIQIIRPIIGEVLPNSIAARAGLKPGDEILRVDGRPTPSLQKVLLAVVERLGEKSTMRIEAKSQLTHKNALYSLDLRDWKVDELNPAPLKSLGIEAIHPSPTLPRNVILNRKYPPLKALTCAFNETNSFISYNYIILKKMVERQVPLGSLGGPITIFKTADTAFRQGVSVFLGFLALVSVMLAFINILPIPGLDGGHLLNFLIEFIIRRPLPIKYEMASIQIGMLLLIFIMLLATFNDLLRLLGNHKV
jgi:regulator of sigma E protease